MAEVRLPKPQAPAPAGRMRPEDIAPSELVARLLAEGETDYATVDFPRKTPAGEVIARVHIRLLSDHEEANALANALLEMKQMLRSGEGKGHPTLEWNLTCRHILAVACRRDDDPKQPFFRHGVADVRQFTTRELGELWLAYVAVQNAALPSLGAMDREELEAWADRVKEGVGHFPFYFSSQENVSTFLSSVADYVVEMRTLLATLATPDAGSSTLSSGMPSSEAPGRTKATRKPRAKRAKRATRTDAKKSAA
jgi:hypothetical protein